MFKAVVSEATYPKSLSLEDLLIFQKNTKNKLISNYLTKIKKDPETHVQIIRSLPFLKLIVRNESYFKVDGHIFTNEILYEMLENLQFNFFDNRYCHYSIGLNDHSEFYIKNYRKNVGQFFKSLIIREKYQTVIGDATKMFVFLKDSNEVIKSYENLTHKDPIKLKNFIESNTIEEKV